MHLKCCAVDELMPAVGQDCPQEWAVGRLLLDVTIDPGDAGFVAKFEVRSGNNNNK